MVSSEALREEGTRERECTRFSPPVEFAVGLNAPPPLLATARHRSSSPLAHRSPRPRQELPALDEGYPLRATPHTPCRLDVLRRSRPAIPRRKPRRRRNSATILRRKLDRGRFFLTIRPPLVCFLQTGLGPRAPRRFRSGWHVSRQDSSSRSGDRSRLVPGHRERLGRRANELSGHPAFDSSGRPRRASSRA